MTSSYIIMSKTLRGDTDDLMWAADGKRNGFEKSMNGSRNKAQTPCSNCQMTDITNTCQDFKKGENPIISRRPYLTQLPFGLSPIREEVISVQESSLLSENYSDDSDSEYHDNVSSTFERENTHKITARQTESPNITWPHSTNGHLASKGKIPKASVHFGGQSLTTQHDVVKNTQIPYLSVSHLSSRSLNGSSKICDSCGFERKDLSQADMNSNSTTALLDVCKSSSQHHAPYSLVPTQGLTLPLKSDSKDTSHYMVVPLFKGKEKLTRRQTIGLWLMKGFGFIIVAAILIWLFSSVIL